jgi:hypothetical protein
MVFLSLSSIGFLAMAREDYRKEFRSIRFVRFDSGWFVIYMAVFLGVIAYFGWLYFEQVLFYMTATPPREWPGLRFAEAALLVAGWTGMLVTILTSTASSLARASLTTSQRKAIPLA